MEMTSKNVLQQGYTIKSAPQQKSIKQSILCRQATKTSASQNGLAVQDRHPLLPTQQVNP